MEMADLDENNEFFDLISYPEKVENIADKQGIAIKGTNQKFLGAGKALKSLLEKRMED